MGVNSKCCEHDFMKPVVIRTKSKGDFPFTGTTEKEAAVIFCRRCGVGSVMGWGIQQDQKS